jgi:hypothetical protein
VWPNRISRGRASATSASWPRPSTQVRCRPTRFARDRFVLVVARDHPLARHIAVAFAQVLIVPETTAQRVGRIMAIAPVALSDSRAARRSHDLRARFCRATAVCAAAGGAFAEDRGLRTKDR